MLHCSYMFCGISCAILRELYIKSKNFLRMAQVTLKHVGVM